jgi:nitrite reductase (NO-forming)
MTREVIESVPRRYPMRYRTALSALVVAFVLALAACGGDDATDIVDAPDAADGGSVTVDVTAQDIEFSPASVDVPSGATVEFNVTNEGNLEHDLVFEDGSETGIVAPGDTGTVSTSFTESTVGWCDVPGHREAGMELEINVTD